MPAISYFLGITIGMFFDDHPWPHFHVRYAEYSAVVSVGGLEIRAGRLPPRVLGLVREWGQIHQQELWENWERADKSERLRKIPPLS